MRSGQACSARKGDGSQCGGRPRPGSVFCLFHDPAAAGAQREAKAEGDRRRSAARAVVPADSQDLRLAAPLLWHLRQTEPRAALSGAVSGAFSSILALSLSMVAALSPTALATSTVSVFVEGRREPPTLPLGSSAQGCWRLLSRSLGAASALRSRSLAEAAVPTGGGATDLGCVLRRRQGPLCEDGGVPGGEPLRDRKGACHGRWFQGGEGAATRGGHGLPRAGPDTSGGGGGG